MLNGIDISAWQRGIDAASVPSDFVIVKATQGLDYINDDCDRAYQQAKAAGKKLGVYLRKPDLGSNSFDSSKFQGESFI